MHRLAEKCPSCSRRGPSRSLRGGVAEGDRKWRRAAAPNSKKRTQMPRSGENFDNKCQMIEFAIENIVLWWMTPPPGPRPGPALAKELDPPSPARLVNSCVCSERTTNCSRG